MKLKPVHFILALVAMPVVAIAILGFTHSFQVRDLKPLGQVAPFELTDTKGRMVTLDDYRKKIWIASFIFSHCGEQCPRINEEMKHLQKVLKSKENIRLVSITLDPKRDTPAVLAEYATRYQADPEKWVFLTGESKAIKDVVTKSFKLAAENSSEGDVVHSSRLVLVDNRGTIRGYYDAMDKNEVRTLVSDAKSLLRGLY